ncbi:MAG: molecular chaperone HtpG [Bacilli bacterium]
MKKKQFKAESKKLLDLMIHSIYSNKEIFLRELISNGSDAIDKLYYESLTNHDIKVNKKKLGINIDINKDKRLLTISDTGCGMTKDELEDNLGTIAKSGSLLFKEENKMKKDIDIIGQFGVGFYSAFMVSDNVKVISKSYKEEQAHSWESDGADGYIIKDDEKDDIGTTIILKIKEDTEEENYSKYLEEYTIKDIIKKYSDYIRYPITMKNDDKKEAINSMKPLWKKDKKKITEEEYNNFYSEKFNDFEKPLKTISLNTEGLTSYNALLFIPSHIPYDFYTKEYEKGLQLYASGVMIMDKCKDLIPDYFSFVKGVVDSDDLSLNISREILQQDPKLKTIANSIEKKIKKELLDMLENDKENYIKFFKAFGNSIKYGIYSSYGMKKEFLQDLLLFDSSKKDTMITLKDYVANMKEDQDKIYYATGESVDKINMLPQVDKFKEKDIDVLYLTDNIDEFVLQMMMNYDNKSFVNISSGDIDLDSEEEKENLKKLNEENKDLFEDMKKYIAEVESVRFTNRLKNHPVCLSTEGGISTSMEKTLNEMPIDEKVKAKTILEINDKHPIVKKLEKLHKNKDTEELKKYSKVLYAQAKLIEGLSLDNPTEISNLICEIIAK